MFLVILLITFFFLFSDKGIIPSECKDTADLLLLFDKLFDSLNGSYNKKGKHGKPYLGALTPNSIHHKMWNSAKKCLKTMHFVNKHGRERCVPTVSNWLWTLEGVENLIDKVGKEYKVTSIWTRHLNQDPLENFFGSIRNQGCRNNNPSAASFQSSFTSLIINNLTSIHAVGSNCEDDFCDALQTYIVADSTASQKVHEVNDNHLLIETTPLEEKKNNIKVMASLTYVAGYILRQCKKFIFKSCVDCNQNLSNINNDACDYIKHREYAGRNWLCYPSNEMILIISEIQDIFAKIMEDDFNKCFLKDYIKTVLLVNVDFNSISCNQHKTQLLIFLVDCSIRFFFI